MRMLTFVGFSVACALLLGIGGLRAAGCDPSGLFGSCVIKRVLRIYFSCRGENGCSLLGWWRMARSV
jgi:hypothetical protein